MKLIYALLLPAVCALAAGPDDLFAPLVTPQSPGFAVLVLRDGKVLFEKGYGRGIDARSNFRLASLSKQFTAEVVHQLVVQGKLRYDTKLSDVFPEFPSWARAVTVRHLLTHTGGLPDYETVMDRVDPNRWTPAHQIQDAEVLELLQREPKPKFAAGTSWSYSNSGYVVLGLIAAKVGGESFPELLRRLIFEPLGMHDTVAYVNGVNSVSNRVYGSPRDQSSTSATLGDGGIYSNLRDLAKWDAALRGRMSPMVEAARLDGGGRTYWPNEKDDDNLAPGKPVAYGFGWFVDPYEGRERMWHSGSSTGFRTIIQRFTREKLTIIILANRGGSGCHAAFARSVKILLT